MTLELTGYMVRTPDPATSTIIVDTVKAAFADVSVAAASVIFVAAAFVMFAAATA